MRGDMYSHVLVRRDLVVPAISTVYVAGDSPLIKAYTVPSPDPAFAII